MSTTKFCERGFGGEDFFKSPFPQGILGTLVRYNITVSLAYYPPYHSKYNPIERVWGRLEQYWNGELLDSQEKVLTLAKSMTWKEKKTSVEVLKKSYKKGISVSKKIMPLYDAMIERLDGLERWFVDIIPKLCTPPDF